MNRVSSRLAFAGLLLAISCGNPNVLTLGQTWTLQGILADAVTGARIGGDVKVYLVQGSEVRGPSRLITSGDLMGEYAFSGIPANFAGGSNQNWKLVVVKTGYQRFESEISTLGNFGLVDEATGAPVNVISDGAYSRIGNVYLFATGVTAPDYSFTATYNGKPVQGATVLLDPIVGSNATVFATGNVLAASPGYVPSITAPATDANGVTKVVGTSLALGAAYKVQVLPVQFKETASSTPITIGTFNPTAGAGSAPFIAGLGTIDQRIALVDLTPSPVATPLYVVSVTNSASGQLQPNGTLQVTFNIPVTISDPKGYDAILHPGTQANGTPGTGKLNCAPGPAYCGGTAGTAQPVTASLSADGLTLTLAPNYTAAPAGTERGLSIDYTEGPPAGAPAGVAFPLIEPKDYPGVPFSIFTAPGGGVTQVRKADGTPVSGVVQMTAP